MFKSFIKRKMANFIVRLIEGLNPKKKSDLYSKLKSSFFHETYNNFRNTYSIAENFKFNGENILFYGKGNISCGKDSYIGSYSTIQAFDNYNVIIGDNCSISHNVRIYTSSHKADQNLNNKNIKERKSGDVIINNGVWIGANVFINPGVTIGENTIIGSNSVVTKNMEPHAIYGGIPAKLIRYKDYNEKNPYNTI